MTCVWASHTNICMHTATHTQYRVFYFILQSAVSTLNSTLQHMMVSSIYFYACFTLSLCFTYSDVLLFQRDQHHFSQCLSAVLSTLTSQLIAALSGQYNPERQYISDNIEASTKWLEQMAAIGVLVKFEALMQPDRVSKLHTYSDI